MANAATASDADTQQARNYRRSTQQTRRPRPETSPSQTEGGPSAQPSSNPAEGGRRERIGNKFEKGIANLERGGATDFSRASEDWARKQGFGNTRVGAVGGAAQAFEQGGGANEIARGAAGGAARNYAQEAANRRGLSQAKGSGVAAAAESLAEGEGAKAATEKGGAAVLQAKKIQQFRRLLLVVRGVSAISIVGIVITILIWGLQLYLGHVLNRPAWKLGRIEMILALFVWIIITIVVFVYAIIMLLLYGGIIGAIDALF